MDWIAAPDAWLSRLVLQRGLALVYLLAFLSAAREFRPLAGERGLTPAPVLLRALSFRQAPSLFHLRYSDRLLAAVAWLGAALAAAVALGAADAVPLWASMPLWAVLWVLYLSVVNIGGTWYAFGWESLLLEAGFLAIFLGNDSIAPPTVGLYLMIWLVFRVELGAGLIKWRGDPCWRKLTCLYYHHETQPMPGPLSWFFHHLPRPLHRVESAANHVAQLIAPFGLFLPQPAATWAALVVIVTQLWLVASGNFAWLNWLTMILAVAAVDGALAARHLPLPDPPADQPDAPTWFAALLLAAAALVAFLSRRPVANLLSSAQEMNRPYNGFHLANTYGAFGSVTRHRYEVVLEGTNAPSPDGAARWREYEFHGKPGDVRRLPRQFAPFHLRLDWLMWFAALSPYAPSPWLHALVQRLLAGDRTILRLLRVNPFPDHPPTHIRARLYSYRFTTWRELRTTGAWWHRTPEGDHLPPRSLPHPPPAA
ncbi:lipase maturation factor family protein [Streptomyces litchfieldiae]|uniref:Lipase maturation factor family protein n=1 Tax=Streptomyces litchfieldiae TaxID=3075543 RepID=A0ABU2MZQ1_9ACTN|nr:lipase maturation factor family protein [Streptomyces sp. DSM 44938]MDT0347126.1 lipase maturation factor family protein [Streptomyces sp. DSM 44938]